MIDNPSSEKLKQEQKERIEAYAEHLAGHASILSEKEYQHFIMERLSKDNGYVIRKAVNYDRLFAVDREMLFKFLNATQPDEMAALRKLRIFLSSYTCKGIAGLRYNQLIKMEKVV